jgi:arylsulfatase A-like enzyme
VPFFISGYRGSAGNGPATSDELVCWEDIAPTILDLAGVDIPPSMEGISLLPLLRGEPASRSRDHIFGQCEGHHHNLWIVTKQWKYLWFPRTNEEQLFDLRNDPGECHDLSAESPAIHELRDLLAKHVEGRKDIAYQRDQLRPCGNRPPSVFWSA